MPVRLPVKPLLADAVVNAAAAGVTLPITVLLIVPPVTTRPVPKLTVPVAVRLVNVPAAALLPPITVLLTVLPVMAKLWRAELAIKAVPAELIMATL